MKRVPSEDKQNAIDKCIQQLVNCAALNTMLQAKKKVLQVVCHDYCHMTQEERGRLQKKQELYSATAAWVCIWCSIICSHFPLGWGKCPYSRTFCTEDNGHPSPGAVLGKDVMKAIWADMALTELLSWVSDVPHNWGTPTWGKLSANNWRVICMAHLPITLIRLWSGDNVPEDQKSKLENFMDLVCVVQIANLCSISKEHIKCYKSYIVCYMTTYKSLYKLTKVKHIHHAALHYSDILWGIGPAHMHSTAFYEQYIYAIQSKNHNMKFGL